MPNCLLFLIFAFYNLYNKIDSSDLFEISRFQYLFPPKTVPLRNFVKEKSDEAKCMKFACTEASTRQYIKNVAGTSTVHDV